MSLGQSFELSGLPARGRESEFALALPLWRSGQRAAGEQAAQSQLGWASAFEQAERLRLAGQVREAIIALHLAEVEQHRVHRYAETLRQLYEDVQRRVRAGDLAPADALAARAQWLTARAQASAAVQDLGVEQARWRLLTGLAPLNLPVFVAPTVSRITQTHPELLLANAAVDLAQRRAQLVRLQPLDSPELTLGMRQDKSGQGAGSKSGVVMAIRLPIGDAIYQQPRVAAALDELALAQIQAQRTQERLEAELVMAQSQLSQSLTQLDVHQERATLLDERARLIDKSFRVGETALPEMLRALAEAASADSAHVRQKITHQLAIARLEQALGLLP